MQRNLEQMRYNSFIPNCSEPEDVMTRGATKIVFVSAIFALLVCARTGFGAEPSFESIKKIAVASYGLNAAELKALEQGEIVTKKLESDEKREIAVAGIIKFDIPFEIVLEAYQRALDRQKRESAKSYGKFQYPPTIESFEKLDFDEKDLADLKNCRIDSCKWNLSADMIQRLRDEIDWNADDHISRASNLVKKMLVEYIAEFLKGGSASLMEYRDRPDAVKIADDYASLRESLVWPKEFAPEFLEFIEEYPNKKLGGIEDTMSWTNIKVGLKPVLLITHNTNYRKDSKASKQAILFSRQIYANHYFDSTQSMTAITEVPNSEGKPETYLLFVSRSRSGALGGSIGKLVGGIVEGQAVERLEGILEDTKQNTALVLANREAEAAPKQNEGISSILLKRTAYVWVIIILGMIAVAGFLVWKTSRRKGL